MRYLTVPLTLATTLAIVVALFHLKQEVGDLERELSQVDRAIAAHRETLRVLRTEWSFLNQPTKVAELARRHLGMRPNTTAQVIRLEDLPMRGDTARPAQTAAALIAPAGHK